jgi:hypothetical protein
MPRLWQGAPPRPCSDARQANEVTFITLWYRLAECPYPELTGQGERITN